MFAVMSCTFLSAVIAFRWCQFACVSLMQCGVNQLISDNVKWYIRPQLSIYLKICQFYCFFFCMNGRSAAISHFKEGKYLNSHSPLTELSYEISFFFHWCWGYWYTWTAECVTDWNAFNRSWCFFLCYKTDVIWFETFQSSSGAQCLCLLKHLRLGNVRVCWWKLLCQKYYFWCHAWDVTWS